MEHFVKSVGYLFLENQRICQTFSHSCLGPSKNDVCITRNEELNAVMGQKLEMWVKVMWTPCRQGEGVKNCLFVNVLYGLPIDQVTQFQLSGMKFNAVYSLYLNI